VDDPGGGVDDPGGGITDDLRASGDLTISTTTSSKALMIQTTSATQLLNENQFCLH
jgi:hypothetical protein